MKLTFITMAITICSIMLHISTPFPVIAGIEEFCADKWPSDYEMRQYCENQQVEANRKLFSLGRDLGLVNNGSLSASTTGSDKEKIISRCMDKWELTRFKTYDFQMVVYCIDQQYEAYTKTGSDSETTPTKGIEGFCADKWPDDYRMRQYCYDQQAEGNAKLFKIAASEGLVNGGRLSTSPNGGPVERLINRCMKKWEQTHYETFDFRMVVYCIEKNR